MRIEDIHIGAQVSYEPLDLIGTVVDYMPSLDFWNCCIGVDFSPHLCGHTLGGFKSEFRVTLPGNTGWWCEPALLTLVERDDGSSFTTTSSEVFDFLGLNNPI